MQGGPFASWVVGCTAVAFVVSMAEAHHALAGAAPRDVRWAMGTACLALAAARAFAEVGGAGRRSLSEDALRSQALRQQETFTLLMESKDAEISRLRVDLAALRKTMITREDSLQAARRQLSSQSAEMVKLLAQHQDLREQLVESDAARAPHKKAL